MRVVFVSNYLNHHQLPLALALHGAENVEFTFIATKEITEYRKNLGYKEYNLLYDFVLCSYLSEKNFQKALSLCDECDVLIYGIAPKELIRNRLNSNKLTFRYSERIYKEKPCPWYEILPRAIKYRQLYGKNPNLYLLCASAYTASDYAKTKTFLNKAYKWGYFTETKRYGDIDALISEKKRHSILWAGRLMGSKHPEVTIAIAKRLKKEGYAFTLNIIGTGEMEEALKQEIQKEHLTDCVHLLGSMPPEEVREHMEKSEIFLFTSDRNEGWGAVLNEAMNSACALVASHAIGSVPFLIEDNQNGYIYRDGDLNDLFYKVKQLFDHDEERRRLSKEAYTTIIEEWNPENAAQHLLLLANNLLSDTPVPNLFKKGVCSKAMLLADDWYEHK